MIAARAGTPARSEFKGMLNFTSIPLFFDKMAGFGKVKAGN